MPSEKMPVGVVMERRTSDHPWEDVAVRPVAIVPGAAAESVDRTLADGEGWVQYYAGMLELELHHTETADYLYNLANDPPAVYVMLREDLDAADGVAPFAVTVSPSEAQSYLDAEENLVEVVPMPPAILGWVGAFVERYHVDRPVYKRQRKPYDPRKSRDPTEPPVARLEGKP